MTILILFQLELVVADKGEVDSTLEGIPTTLPLERRESFEAETEDVYACKGTKAAAAAVYS